MALRSRAGFTLVELMVAMIAGAFVVSSIYYLFGMSAKSLSQQTQVSDSQMALRAAMDQIRRDVARAGYLAAPDTRLLRNCDGALNGADNANVYTNSARTPANRFTALGVTANGSISNTLNATRTEVGQMLDVTNNKVRADDITMYGNYVTADQYLTESLPQSTSSRIYVKTTSEAFRRSFFTPGAANAAATFNGTEFQNVFAAGRMLRIETGGRFFFRNIAGSDVSNAATPFITLSDALPASPCVEIADWMAIAPVSGVRYGIESDSATDFARVRAPTAGVVPGQRRTMLVRREVDVNGALIAGTGRLVLDYAVEFGADAIVNTAANPLTDRPAWAYSLHGDVTTASATPNRFRSLLVTIATRSADADTRVTNVGRRIFAQAGLLNSPLMTFRVIDPNFLAVTNMFARVRTMRSEILLENF